MIKVRSISKQFERDKVERLRALQNRLEILKQGGNIPKVITEELQKCIEIGLLYASLQMACTLMEYCARKARAIVFNPSLKRGGSRLQNQILNWMNLEENRKAQFNTLLCALASEGLLTEDETESMKVIYEHVRNPLHHGIFGRYNSAREGGGLGAFGLYLANPAEDDTTMELSLMENAIPELELIMNGIEALCKCSEQ